MISLECFEKRKISKSEGFVFPFHVINGKIENKIYLQQFSYQTSRFIF